MFFATNVTRAIRGDCYFQRVSHCPLTVTFSYISDTQNKRRSCTYYDVDLLVN